MTGGGRAIGSEEVVRWSARQVVACGRRSSWRFVVGVPMGCRRPKYSIQWSGVERLDWFQW